MQSAHLLKYKMQSAHPKCKMHTFSRNKCKMHTEAADEYSRVPSMARKHASSVSPGVGLLGQLGVMKAGALVAHEFAVPVRNLRAQAKYARKGTLTTSKYLSFSLFLANRTL